MGDHTTYQFRCHVRENGHERLEHILEECRILYNSALQYKRNAYKRDKTEISWVDLNREFTEIRSNDEFWGNISTHVGRGVLNRLNLAFAAFFRRVTSGETPGFPRFRSHNRYKSVELNIVIDSMLKISSDRKKAYIRIKGLPIIELRPKNGLPDIKHLKTMVFTKKPIGWYVALSYEFVPDVLSPENDEVGIDLGVNNRLALSDGSAIEGRRLDRTQENGFRRQLERRTRRDSKGRIHGPQSNRRKKTSKTLSRETYRNKVRNRNTCHRITTHIVNTYKRIAVEDLKIGNMTKSANDTINEPGRNVSAKRSLNRRILEQTWGLLISQLQCKAAWAGTEVVKVNPAYTSRTCSNCGRKSPQQEYRIYVCNFCDEIFDRDINAARNIEFKAFGTGVGSPPASLVARTIAPLTLIV